MEFGTQRKKQIKEVLIKMDKRTYIKIFKDYLSSENITIEDVSINDLAMVSYYLDNNLFSKAEAIVNSIVIKDRVDNLIN